MGLIRIAVLTAALTLGGCVQKGLNSHLPNGSAAYSIIPAPAPQEQGLAYLIQPGDTLNVRVFQEPDLSDDKSPVDEEGKIQVPLAGEIDAGGHTGPEVAREIAARLGRSYVRDPQVVVSVVASREQKIAVEGEVKMPGVYTISPQETLLSALARAQSPTNVAKLDQVLVFRMRDGRRTGARFDVDEIRAGRAADPQVLGGDVIVVGFSSLRGTYRDILTAAPLLNVFTSF